MKKISLVLTLVAVLATAGLVVADAGDNEGTLNQIAGYRQWTRVNREPVKVEASTVVVASPIGLDTPV
jgi:hypothetical protein